MCSFFSYIYYYYCKFIANIALLTEKPLNEGTGVYCIVWYGIVTILTHFKIERSQFELLPISETSFSLACWFFCLIRMSKFSTENFKVVFMEEFKQLFQLLIVRHQRFGQSVSVAPIILRPT